MALHLIHTSDWHLGHTLHDMDRAAEHAAFISWLTDTIDEEQADALLIAGDIFETANPPASAQRAWYGFLASLRERFPKLDVVAIGGNHDSATRLDAPHALLDGIGMHVIGGLPRTETSAIDIDRMLVPLHDSDGNVAAWVAALPYLRSADLPRVEGEEDSMIAGVRALYKAVVDEAYKRAGTEKAVVAMGHLYMTGTDISVLSERKILGGNQHALPADIFDDRVAYAALGHLHLAQRVGREHVRYSGSPIPLSMAERNYPHQVLAVDLEGSDFVSARALRIPRSVQMRRIPDEKSAPIEEIIKLTAELPDAVNDLFAAPPLLLEVCVRLDRPEPDLRRRVEDLLESKAVRLVKLTPDYTGHGKALGDLQSAARLKEMSPSEVFLRRYERDHDDPPPAELSAAFEELLEQVLSGDRP